MTKSVIADERWRGWSSELTAVDPDVILYPERSFEFSFGSLLVQQSLADVGTTVWDAEVVMAHLVDELGDALRGSSVVELGAGTAIAGMVAHKLGATVVFTELPQVVPATVQNLQSNGVEAPVVEYRWGEDATPVLHAANTRHFDYVLAADVLYHDEHFLSLAEAMFALTSKSSRILLCYEQRRKDLTVFLDILRQQGFVIEQTHIFRIPREDVETMLYAHFIRQADDDDDTAVAAAKSLR